LRRVAAFFNGNGIECGIAAHFVCICNGQANVSVRQYMYACYIGWQNSPTLYNIVEYFEMRLRQHLYVNGYGGVEPVVSVPSRIDFGPEGTGSPVAIEIILGAIRSQALPSTSHSDI
jgi:hypothetical protein